MDEAFGMGLVGQAQDMLTRLAQLRCPPVVDSCGRHQPQTNAVVPEVVPGEEVPPPHVRGKQAVEEIGIAGVVLGGLELGLRERVAVGYARPGVAGILPQIPCKR